MSIFRRTTQCCMSHCPDAAVWAIQNFNGEPSLITWNERDTNEPALGYCDKHGRAEFARIRLSQSANYQANVAKWGSYS